MPTLKAFRLVEIILGQAHSLGTRLSVTLDVSALGSSLGHLLGDLEQVT